jgi:hypothetical protein
MLGFLCEILTGHRLGPWVPFFDPEVPRLRFERAACRWCRERFVRPRRLTPIERRVERQESRGGLVPCSRLSTLHAPLERSDHDGSRPQH